MRPILIDTNVYSNAMVGNNNAVDALKKNSSIGFSVISIGELLSGFKGGYKETENRMELESFLDSPGVTTYSKITWPFCNSLIIGIMIIKNRKLCLPK